MLLITARLLQFDPLLSLVASATITSYVPDSSGALVVPTSDSTRPRRLTAVSGPHPRYPDASSDRRLTDFCWRLHPTDPGSRRRPTTSAPVFIEPSTVAVIPPTIDPLNEIINVYNQASDTWSSFRLSSRDSVKLRLAR